MFVPNQVCYLHIEYVIPTVVRLKKIRPDMQLICLKNIRTPLASGRASIEVQ